VNDAPVAVGQPGGECRREMGDWGNCGHRQLQAYTVSCGCVRRMVSRELAQSNRGVPRRSTIPAIPKTTMMPTATAK
jgi:hypothetical protein